MGSIHHQQQSDQRDPAGVQYLKYDRRGGYVPGTLQQRLLQLLNRSLGRRIEAASDLARRQCEAYRVRQTQSRPGLPLEGSAAEPVYREFEWPKMSL